MSNSPVYEDTRRKVAEARERRLAKLVVENAALRKALATARDWMLCDSEFGDPEDFKRDLTAVDAVLGASVSA